MNNFLSKWLPFIRLITLYATICLPALAKGDFEFDISRYSYSRIPGAFTGAFTGDFTNSQTPRIDELISPFSVSGNNNQTFILTEGGTLFELQQEDFDINWSLRKEQISSDNDSGFVVWQKRVLKYSPEGDVRYKTDSKSITVEAFEDEDWTTVNVYFIENESGDISGLLVSPDGLSLVALSSNGSFITIFDVSNNGRTLTVNKVFRSDEGYPFLKGPYDASFTPDNAYLIVSCSRCNALIGFKKTEQQWSQEQVINRTEIGPFKNLAQPKGIKFMDSMHLIVALNDPHVHGVMLLKLENNVLMHHSTFMTTALMGTALMGTALMGTALMGTALMRDETTTRNFKYPEKIWMYDSTAIVSTDSGLTFFQITSTGQLGITGQWLRNSKYSELAAVNDLHIQKRNSNAPLIMTVINTNDNMVGVYELANEVSTDFPIDNNGTTPVSDSSSASALQVNYFLLLMSFTFWLIK